MLTFGPLRKLKVSLFVEASRALCRYQYSMSVREFSGKAVLETAIGASTFSVALETFVVSPPVLAVQF